MDGFEFGLAGVLVAIAVLNALASRIGIPYPIVLVLGGLVLGVMPGIPEIEPDPDLVLFVFLPPLLYGAAFFSDLKAIRGDARALSLSAVGLVLVTVVLVAVVGHFVLELTWPVAFALGAVVSPTDPVAATSIMRRLSAPRRIINLVEGESLVNDATALVAYRAAVAAAVGGTFSLLDASARFVIAAVGGVALGLAVGFVISRCHGRSGLVRRHREATARPSADPRACRWPVQGVEAFRTPVHGTDLRAAVAGIRGVVGRLSKIHSSLDLT